MKALILDAGPIINLSINGLLYAIEGLKKNFDGKFLITKDVKREIYDKPITIKKFELGAIRINKLIEKKVLELPETIKVNLQELEQETQRLMELANHSFKVSNQWLRLISRGEASCIALSSELAKRNIQSLIAVDERTARILCEKPTNLEKLMSKKLHKKVRLVDNNVKKLKRFEFIRSPELIYTAYKKGLIKLNDKRALEALLYATKFKGSSISYEEIEILKKLK